MRAGFGAFRASPSPRTAGWRSSGTTEEARRPTTQCPAPGLLLPNRDLPALCIATATILTHAEGAVTIEIARSRPSSTIPLAKVAARRLISWSSMQVRIAAANFSGRNRPF
jgi:hypothetical protein